VKMLVSGRDVSAERTIDVRNPFDGSIIDSVPEATTDHVEQALAAAVEGAALMERMSRFERAAILARVSGVLRERVDELALLLASEVGKTIREARGEVHRAVQTFAVASEEARRLAGEIVPFDGAPTGGDRFGFYIRVPVGIVVAITPFNFPLNLAAHKVAPAIAGGNAVVLKPASTTPLTDIELGRILVECGLPGEAISVLTGSGRAVGDPLVTDSRPRMVTFTGSAEVGRGIAARAGLKKLAMELGSNSAVVVCDSADVEAAAERSVRGAFALAGQVCISVQRVLVHDSVFEAFVDRARELTSELVVGDQLDDATDVGPMIDEENAQRAADWIREAADMGAEIVSGAGRQGTLVEPTILTGVPDSARLWKDEAFAPVMAVRSFSSFDEAIAAVNDSRYGLQAGVYSERLDEALRAAHEIRCGGVMINDVPTFRVDLMPYGGEKDSGLGREGPRFALEEMTEVRVVGMRRLEG
jgi:glyceraldehyde-3-phosphate dehydrogenase (NADP+)